MLHVGLQEISNSHWVKLVLGTSNFTDWVKGNMCFINKTLWSLLFSFFLTDGPMRFGRDLEGIPMCCTI